MGAGVVGTAALGAEAGTAPPVLPGAETTKLVLRVNGLLRELAVLPRTTLLDVLRGPLGLTGTKPGCERGECGACTVLIAGEPRYACQTLALEAEGHEVDHHRGSREGRGALGRAAGVRRRRTASSAATARRAR